MKKLTTKKWVNKNGNFFTMNEINAKKFGRIHRIFYELKNVHMNNAQTYENAKHMDIKMLVSGWWPF